MEEFRHDWNKRVLIVDDQPEIHADFEEILKSKRMSTDRLAAAFVGEQKGMVLPEFELLHAETGAEAYNMICAARIENQPISVAYIDIRMQSGMDGLETIRSIREFERDIEIVLMTAYTDKILPETVQKMTLLHKLLYIRKPFAREEIQLITLCLAGKWNIEQDLKAHRQDLTVSHRRRQPVDSHVVRPLEEVERDALVHALEVFNRNVTKVAQALEIDLETLHRKMKKYDLSA